VFTFAAGAAMAALAIGAAGVVSGAQPHGRAPLATEVTSGAP